MDRQFIKNPLCLALDVNSIDLAKSLAEDCADIIGCVKVGPRLLQEGGRDLCRYLTDRAPLFIDCKYFDIPSTMLASIQSAFDLGASLVTIHSLAGPEALRQIAELENRLNQQRPFKVLAVTILTSFDPKSFTKNFHSYTIVEHVEILAKAIVESGLSGVVCSAQELNILKSFDLFKVTPGVRIPEAQDQSSQDDQRRTATPFQARQLGSDLLVVGRPILSAASPKAAAQKYLLSLQRN